MTTPNGDDRQPRPRPLPAASLDEVLRTRVWLTRAVEPGDNALYAYLVQHGVVEAVRRIKTGEAPPEIARQAEGRRGVDRVEEDVAAAERHGLRLLVPEDDHWPAAALLPMDVAVGAGIDGIAPPSALWVNGPISLNEATERAVAIVGARASTPYGEHVARELAYALADRGWTIVSGGAYGIDGAAHKAALAAGGTTVAVIAGGLDAPYPSGNAGLFDRIAQTGMLISEWPPSSTPQRHRFLIRNRLIAGLVAGTVVVEAAARSGALHTARRTRELGRPVMAVPGPITSAMSKGTHQLIRRGGAQLVTSVEEILEEIGRLGDDLATPESGPTTPEDRLDGTARRVLDGVPLRTPAPPEAIAQEAGLGVADVLRCLPALEINDLVEATEGGWRLSRSLRDRLRHAHN